MKKKFIAISVICLACILMLVALSACNNNSIDGLVYDVAYFDYNKSPYMNLRSDNPERIDTLEQLTEFCNKADMTIDDKDSLGYDKELCKKFRSYDEKFFKSKSLIVVGKTNGAGYWNYEFGNLKIKDSDLIISILNNDFESDDGDYSMPTIVTQYIWVIEINKTSIENIAQITVQNYKIIK